MSGHYLFPPAVRVRVALLKMVAACLRLLEAPNISVTLVVRGNLSVPYSMEAAIFPAASGEYPCAMIFLWAASQFSSGCILSWASLASSRAFLTSLGVVDVNELCSSDIDSVARLGLGVVAGAGRVPARAVLSLWRGDPGRTAIVFGRDHGAAIPVRASQAEAAGCSVVDAHAAAFRAAVRC